MLGVSGLISGSADGAPAAAEAPESGGAGSGGGGGGSSDVGGGAGAVAGGFGEDEKAARMDELGERNSGGNRWPRQETLALLKIRSDMDAVFKDSSLKGPLWEEVSRKMAELGYHRSSKKCKEKFENVYKYHKRTKEGRASKSDGKTYRFFDQLEAFEHTPSHALPPPPRPQPPLSSPSTMVVAPPPLPVNNNNNASNTVNTTNAVNPPPVQVPAQQVTVPSTQNPLSANVHRNPPPNNAPTFPQSSQSRSLPLPPPPTAANTSGFPSQRNVPGSPFSYSTSSSTSSDEDIQRRHRRKRKWKDFFERLMKDVIVKQEELQKKFLEALEKRERDRLVREEAWRVQEMARMNREHDLLVQERSMAAAKDAAVLQFLQKVSDQHNLQIPITNTTPAQIQIQLPESLPTPAPQPPPPQSQQPPAQGPEPISVAPPATMPFTITTPTPSVPTKNVDVSKPDNNNNNSNSNSNATESFSPARWPKTEVQALIRLRTSMDNKYQENGPKGPLWEEISAGMRKLGYNRNAKRCKEKWENINKYFKKVKESNKKRPEDSKTCPYFHLLDAIYKERAKNEASFNPPLKPENNPMVPIMVQPEQQWPLPPEHHDHESDNIDDGEGDEDYDEVGGYEIVTNKQQSTTITTTATSTV